MVKNASDRPENLGLGGARTECDESVEKTVDQRQSTPVQSRNAPFTTQYTTYIPGMEMDTFGYLFRGAAGLDYGTSTRYNIFCVDISVVAPLA
jgi:hypothetical protein